MVLLLVSTEGMKIHEKGTQKKRHGAQKMLLIHLVIYETFFAAQLGVYSPQNHRMLLLKNIIFEFIFSWFEE